MARQELRTQSAGATGIGLTQNIDDPTKAPWRRKPLTNKRSRFLARCILRGMFEQLNVALAQPIEKDNDRPTDVPQRFRSCLGRQRGDLLGRHGQLREAVRIQASIA